MRFSFFQTLTDFIFPNLCAGCEKSIPMPDSICEACSKKIFLRPTHLSCGKCGARLPYHVPICHKNFPYITGSATSYADQNVRTLLHRLKFKSIERAAIPLTQLLISFTEKSGFPLQGWTVVPIPLSRERARERGFNQAERIGYIYAHHFRAQFMPELLTRTRATHAQTKLSSYAERMQNIEGCFDINPKKAIPSSIILIDDVITSGATMTEAAETLKSNGARRIIGLTVARA